MALGPAGPRLWQVGMSGGRYVANREAPLEAPAAVDPKLVAKDWNEFVKPRLNLALVPPDQVFVRVVQLPKTDELAETVSMLEFQLEKLSPLPATQICWTFELIPNRGLSESQTAILVVVPRQLIEEFLGKLEGFGYLPDRLELPFIDQLLALEVNRDSTLLFPVSGAKGVHSFWVAWWYGGTLQCLGQIYLPSDGSDPIEALKAQLGQMAWAAELEGWLASTPRYSLVADETTAAEWLPKIQAKLDPAVDVVPAAPEHVLASLAARRATQSAAKVALLPPEFVARYKQQFVDKLWMQGLFGVLALYLFGLLFYFGVVAIKTHQRDNLMSLEISQGNAYTNAIRIRDQVRVLQDQVNLQFAALNCYLAVATNLPSELTLENLNFDRGAKLSIYGTGGAEAAPRVYDFLAALKRAKFKEQLLFGNIDGPSLGVKPGGALIGWNFSCEIRKAELE